MQRNEATVLLRMVELRFGSLSPEMRQRILDADAETILAWSDRVLTAQTLEELEMRIRIDEWVKELQEMALREGMQQGMQRGEATVLLRQMELKFGTLSPEARQRILDANAETLLAWSERVLTAQTAEEVSH